MKTSTILVIVGIAIMTGSFFALVIGVDMVRTGPAEPNEWQGLSQTILGYGYEPTANFCPFCGEYSLTRFCQNCGKERGNKPFAEIYCPVCDYGSVTWHLPRICGSCGADCKWRDKYKSWQTKEVYEDSIMLMVDDPNAGISIKAYEPNEPNVAFGEYAGSSVTEFDPNLLDQSSFYPHTVTFSLGNDESAVFNIKEKGVLSCNISEAEFRKVLPKCLYSCMKDIDPNEKIVIEWAEPNEPRSGWGSDIGCVELKEVK